MGIGGIGIDICGMKVVRRWYLSMKGWYGWLGYWWYWYWYWYVSGT